MKGARIQIEDVVSNTDVEGSVVGFARTFSRMLTVKGEVHVYIPKYSLSPGTALDRTSVAKGYAIDVHFLMSCGLDAVAMASSGKWQMSTHRVKICHPLMLQLCEIWS